MTTIPEPLALAIFWLALSGSLVFSLLAAIESWMEYFDVRWTYQQTKGRFTNGRLIIARFRKVGGFWYVVGFNLMAAIFILVTYRAIVEPPEAEDTYILAALTRLLALFLAFAFWRTMRAQREIRKRLKEVEEIADVKRGVEEVHDLQEKTYEKIEEVDHKLCNSEIADENRKASDEARAKSDEARAVSDEARAVADEAREASDQAREKGRG